MAPRNQKNKPVIMACANCLERNYVTSKPARAASQSERLELKKFCPRCNAHVPHRETR